MSAEFCACPFFFDLKIKLLTNKNSTIMKDIIQTPKDKRQLESMISMMESLYCYNQLKPDSRYLEKYREYFTEQVFTEIYRTEHARLKTNYRIEYHVYTDSEGCTYNSLVPIK